MNGGAANGGSLPLALSSLVGRRREIDAVAKLLGAARLVTIVGSGGSGKTRLALAAASQARARFGDGVWWTGLAALTGAGLLPGVVAGVLGVPQSPGEDLTDVIVGQLRQRVTLLVLDNCEHVVDETAELSDRLLRTCPGLSVLATSREVIGVSGERVYRVSGLSLPGAGGEPRSSEAVQLFTERAEQAGLAVGPGELAAVTRLCQRLDGMPLAIELAAARVATLGVEEIAARLEEDQGFLRHPSRSAPARHQTLQATLDWSYRLLRAEEQLLFRRLSVFQGTFSLLAAESVGAGGHIERKDVVDLLGGLVDKSLVQVADRGAEHRYRLLGTVRQYAAALPEPADTPGAGEEAHAAHTRFFLALAEQAEAGLNGPDQPRWLDRLEVEHDNLRAVLRRTLPAHPEAGGRLAGLLWPFWYRRGYYHEARAWLEEAVRLRGEMSAAVAAATLTGAGVLAFLQCDYELATARLTEARDLHEQQENRVGAASALQRLGSIAREQGHYGQARRLHEESLAVWAGLDDPAGVAACQDYLGFVAWLEADFAAAASHCSRALAFFEAAGRRQEAAAAQVNLGVAARYQGETAHATRCLEQALAVSRDLGYLEGVAWALAELGAMTAGTGPDAGAMLAEALRTHVALGDRWRTASVVEAIAALAVTRPDPATAVVLLGASDALRQRLGTPVPPAEQPAVAATLAAAKHALAAAVFAENWASGQSLPVTDAVELACQAAESRPGQAAAPGESGLTERELAVLRLISEGLTNREIGGRLFISAGTAGVHVSNILRKLGVTSRVQAAGIAKEMGL
ncbi:MAG TPA: LuxR C-terminal-related transcriptional regulator [Streptosporangiaceae bacterium]|nr:LuxR C-terminal-related transcriptional regulator [Streptosporangiaceae bacterium]